MTRLEVLRTANAIAGLVAEIEELPTELDCPVHEVPMLLHRLKTINGWQGVTVCPAFDGSCRYDPNGHPQPVDAPAEQDAPADGPAPQGVAGVIGRAAY